MVTDEENDGFVECFDSEFIDGLEWLDVAEPGPVEDADPEEAEDVEIRGRGKLNDSNEYVRSSSEGEQGWKEQDILRIDIVVLFQVPV